MSDEQAERPAGSLPEPPVLSEPPGPSAPLFPAREAEPAAPFWTQPSGQPPVWGSPNPTTPLPYPSGATAYAPPAASPPAARPPQRRGWIAGAVAVVLVAVLLTVLLAVLLIRRPGPSGPVAAPVQGSPSASAAAPGSTSPPQTQAPTPGGPGASGRTPSAGVPSGSAGEWLSAQNAYCRNTVDPAIKAAGADPNSDAAAFFTRMAAINRELDNRLRQATPSSVKTDVDEIAADWDRMATLYERAAAAVRSGNRAEALRDASQAQDANQAGNDLALKVGLADCANAGGIGDSPSPSQNFI